jgi:hypothetical protein
MGYLKINRGAGCLGNPLVRFCEGLRYNRRYGWDIVAPPGNQAETEKTNASLRPAGDLSLLDKREAGSRKQEAGSGKREAGSGKREAGSRKQG